MNPKQLRRKIKSLPLITPKSDPWTLNRIKLRERILNPTEDKGQPEWFLHWPTIQATMYVGQAPYIHKELDQVLEFYPSDILKPGDFFQEPTSYNGMSTNLIHQAYHLLQYEKKLNIQVKELNSIIEFGGGYGAMALIVHRLGFEGDYYIYDYPEFSLLQKYYLNYQDIEVYHLGDNKRLSKYDLLIAIHSLSEVNSADARWNFLMDYPAMSYLFSYNTQWLGLNNYEWFKLIQEDRDDMEWVGWPIEHLPGRYYLVGAE